jgi:hypothetical protein
LRSSDVSYALTAAEFTKDVDRALAVYALLHKSEFNKQKAHVIFDKALPEDYLKAKFSIFNKINIQKEQVKGEIKTTHLYALIIEEKPGDLDPIIFHITDAGLKILISITNLGESGLADNPDLKEQYQKIDAYCDSLKKK